MGCGTEAIIQWGNGRARAFALRCNSWLCPRCRPRRLKRLKAMAYAGQPDTFLTLTCNPAMHEDATTRAQNLVASWRTLVKRIKRHYKYARLDYLVVIEHTKRGEPHLHILARCKWIDQRWLSEQWAELTGAPIVDIRRIKHQRQIVSYVAKYVGKAPVKFARCKRYYRSHRYNTKHVTSNVQHDWSDSERVKLNATIVLILVTWKGAGYDVSGASPDYLECPLLEGARAPPLSSCGRML